MKPCRVGVARLLAHEKDGAGDVVADHRRDIFVPAGLTVRFHILEDFGGGGAGGDW